jgi:hypothetical protein
MSPPKEHTAAMMLALDPLNRLTRGKTIQGDECTPPAS